VYIEGRLKTRKWQDDSGNDRYSTEIQATDFTFLSTKKESEQNAAASQETKQETKSNVPKSTEPTSASPLTSTNDGEDDLPF
jgi:single-strand DNA-binding protein